MKILGLYMFMPGTAALFIDNRIVGAVVEERFTRIKNDDVYPIQSIDYLLRSNGLTPENLDGVAIASFVQPIPLLHMAYWTIDDYLKQQKEKWYPTFYEGKDVHDFDIFQEKIDWNFYPKEYWAKDIAGLKEQSKTYNGDRCQIIAKHLNVPLEKVYQIYHHRGHAYYAYYSSPFRNEKVLALTLDGWGDDANAAIGIFGEDGRYELLYKTTECAIGRIYRYITLLLGMKPNEHEYKVMGLAPYGKAQIAKKALDVFENTLIVDGIDFKWKTKPTDSYYWFKERLEGCRFDGIAAALQTWTENLIVEWVRNAILKYGISSVVLSGGVAMNVKANGKVSSIPELKKFFVGGSSTDESLAIASAICLAEDLTKIKNEKWEHSKVPYLESLYLGPEAGNDDEEEIIKKLELQKYRYIKNPSNEEIVELLIQGLILARCVGRMEFGQRALCNRSIIADPINIEIVEKINSAIKNRDFWMPFAPVVLDKFAEKYLINPKSILSPHMTIAFDTTSEGFQCMKAGCHPADKTARAQILTQNSNSKMYELLVEFAKKTGRGALLNTSFNLHGCPIVNTPLEAFDVLEKSGLDGLILNNFLIIKLKGI